MELKYFLCSIIGFVVSACCVAVTFVKKHQWRRTSGTIIAIKKSGRRGAAVEIAYRADDRQLVSRCDVSKVEVENYAKRIGQEIEITVSPKDATTIHILSTKSSYVAGFFFMAASVAIFLFYYFVL